MAVAFRSIANTTYATRTNTTVTAPSGIQNNDILLLFGFTGAGGGASPTMTPPGGFAAITLGTGTNPTLVEDSTAFEGRMWAWWKRASGEAGDYTITHTNCSSQGACMAISGAITTGDPWDVATSTQTPPGAEGTISTGLSITTTVPNTLLVFWEHDWGDTANPLTPPTGMTERLDTTAIMYAATQDIAAIGATGTRTMTNNNNGSSNDMWATYMIALKEQPAAGDNFPLGSMMHTSGYRLRTRLLAT